MSQQRLNHTPSYQLTPVDSIIVLPETETIYFDLEIESIPRGAQVLAGIFEDPSGRGHLETLNGASVQFDAITGHLFDTLHEEHELGRLPAGLVQSSNLRFSFRIERLQNTFIPTLEIIARDTPFQGMPAGDRFDLPLGSCDFILPAFRASGPIRLTPLYGYYTNYDATPIFGNHVYCCWPFDIS